jgi:hypothetical protein
LRARSGVEEAAVVGLQKQPKLRHDARTQLERGSSLTNVAALKAVGRTV